MAYKNRMRLNSDVVFNRPLAEKLKTIVFTFLICAHYFVGAFKLYASQYMSSCSFVVRGDNKCKQYNLD